MRTWNRLKSMGHSPQARVGSQTAKALAEWNGGSSKPRLEGGSKLLACVKSADVAELADALAISANTWLKTRPRSGVLGFRRTAKVSRSSITEMAALVAIEAERWPKQIGIGTKLPESESNTWTRSPERATLAAGATKRIPTSPVTSASCLALSQFTASSSVAGIWGKRE